MGSLTSVEDAVIIAAQKYMSPALTAVASLISESGEEMVLIGIVGLLYWSINKELGKKLIIYISFVYSCCAVLKSLVRRPRPYVLNREIKCLKPVNKEEEIYGAVSRDYSFPSVHAANSVSAYGTIAKQTEKHPLRILLCVLIVLVGVSRFVLGAHYPTDVLAGWAIACLAIALYDLLEKKLGRNRTFILVDIVSVLGFLVCTTNDFYSAYGMFLGASLGIMFEEKSVKFEGTKKPLLCVLRTLGGGCLFLVLNSLLKLPFTEAFLNSGTTAAFFVRTVRYAVTVFAIIGLYPACFRFFDKVALQKHND